MAVALTQLEAATAFRLLVAFRRTVARRRAGDSRMMRSRVQRFSGGKPGGERSMIVSAPVRSIHLIRRTTPEAIAAFILLALASPCFAGVNAWTFGDPAGESVGSIVFDPDSQQTLCATSREVRP